MNPTASKVLFAVIALAIAGWWAHDKFENSKAQKKHVERIQLSEEAVVAVAKRYGAIIDWEEKLADPMSGTFSIQIENMIIPESGKPIVVDGFVEDVARHDNQFYIYLNDWHTGSITIRFVLECDAETAKRIIKKNESFGSVAVIAQISSVEKAQLALKSGTQNTEDLAPVEIDSSSLFIAHGKCLEVIFSDN